jgi:hypothetical protein
MVTFNLVDAQQDDDLDSDEETLRSGINTCIRDLFELDIYTKMPQDKVKGGLRNFQRYYGLL